MEDTDDLRKALADLLDLAVEVNKIDQDSSLEQFFDVAEKLDALPFDSNGFIRNGVLSALDAVDISTWRCPEVADDLKLGMRTILLALVSAGLETLPDGMPQADPVKQAQRQAQALAKDMRSQDARKAAHARHKDSRSHKATALADWNESGHTFSSMRSFARQCYKKYDVTDFHTVYEWLRKNDKPKP